MRFNYMAFNFRLTLLLIAFVGVMLETSPVVHGQCPLV